MTVTYSFWPFRIQFLIRCAACFILKAAIGTPGMLTNLVEEISFQSILTDCSASNRLLAGILSLYLLPGPLVLSGRSVVMPVPPFRHQQDSDVFVIIPPAGVMIVKQPSDVFQTEKSKTPETVRRNHKFFIAMKRRLGVSQGVRLSISRTTACSLRATW